MGRHAIRKSVTPLRSTYNQVLSGKGDGADVSARVSGDAQ